jgi:hypothetical protein
MSGTAGRDHVDLALVLGTPAGLSHGAAAGQECPRSALERPRDSQLCRAQVAVAVCEDVRGDLHPSDLAGPHQRPSGDAELGALPIRDQAALTPEQGAGIVSESGRHGVAWCTSDVLSPSGHPHPCSA